jgi:predicted N-acetyltransferase YhbS
MSIVVRAYDFPADFEAVSQFLIRHYQPENRDGNWFQPAWEYMHYHPLLDRGTLRHVGVWEDRGEIVAVAHHEWQMGEAFFQVHPAYPRLKPELLNYAEAHLAGDNGRPGLAAFINDFDHEFEAIASARGYRPDPTYSRPTSRMVIPHPFPAIALPPGFHLQSLAEDDDLAKIDRVLWRGFDHPGEPPAEEAGSREIMLSGPNFRKDLTIVVVAPEGHFVSYCGLWYEPVNRLAYVEPMATDPDYRRLGLGKAAMLEGIRRCAAEGAMVAYVGSDQPFYLATGFEKLYDSRPWIITVGSGGDVGEK